MLLCSIMTLWHISIIWHEPVRMSSASQLVISTSKIKLWESQGHYRLSIQPKHVCSILCHLARWYLPSATAVRILWQGGRIKAFAYWSSG